MKLEEVIVPRTHPELAQAEAAIIRWLDEDGDVDADLRVIVRTAGESEPQGSIDFERHVLIMPNGWWAWIARDEHGRIVRGIMRPPEDLSALL